MTVDVGHSRNFLLHMGSVVVVLLVTVTSLTSAEGHSQVASQRPRIGLVLNGEGAIGFTQIGVLEWLEEHRIPVDYIAGNSIGGLVGGGYATGMSPDEIRHFFEKIDLTVSLFLGDAPYQEKGKWSTSERIKVPGLPELNLEAYMSSKSPDIIVPLLPGIANSYRNLRSFDDLPIPFRCQAADLRTGQVIVLDRGSLPESLRACITLIGVSNPVRQGDRVLVSGAIVDSIPTDLVRRMGADIVIASFTPATTLESQGEKTDFSTPLQQLSRTLDVARMQNEREGLKRTDIVILPDLRGYSAADFTRLSQLIDLGHKAAEAKAASLLPFALSESEWREYFYHRQERRIR